MADLVLPESTVSLTRFPAVLNAISGNCSSTRWRRWGAVFRDHVDHNLVPERKRLASPPEARGWEIGQTQESCVYTGETGADSKISESGATEKGSLFVVPFATGCGLCDPKYQPPTEDWWKEDGGNGVNTINEQHKSHTGNHNYLKPMWLDIYCTYIKHSEPLV